MKKNEVKEVKSVDLNPDIKERTWEPEDFGFIPVNTQRVIFIFKNYELRRRPNNFWLMRRKTTKGTKVEVLVKWYLMIMPNESSFAFDVFTKGLR